MEESPSKKRRYSATFGPDDTTAKRPDRSNQGAREDEEESTEMKLALLASLVPDTRYEILLETLLLANGSVEDAASILNYGTVDPPDDDDDDNDDQDAPEQVALELPEARDLQTLSNANAPLVTFSGDTHGPLVHRPANLYQSSLATFFNSRSNQQSPAKKLLTRANQTLHLYSPEDVAAHTPCSIVHNFLPTHLADALLRELLTETPSFKRDVFQLFDRTVTSPHTMGFYVDHLPEEESQRMEYYYNGIRLTDIRKTPPTMLQVSSVVKRRVNQEIEQRIQTHFGGARLPFQSPDEWSPNTGFVNCYDGGKESVGYHADQLTYLGPRAVIGSLSLGVAREFRVRRVVPKPSAAQDNDQARKHHQDLQGQISIHLPHNSLLVMHADMQEEWKHSIAPAATISPHPIAGNKRINVTYRNYRAAFNPKLTPRCTCGIPCILRCAFKSERNRGRYMWMCETAYTPGKQGCGYFEWALFDADGRPPWDHGFRGKKGREQEENRRGED